MPHPGIGVIYRINAYIDLFRKHDFPVIRIHHTFLLKDAMMSHNPEYTNQVEDMFDVLSYDAVEVMVQSA